MNKRDKEVAASGSDELKVFVRARAYELSLDDLEVVAGGRGFRIVPDG